MAQQPSPEGPEFGIQRLYVKDLSFESPNSPGVFLENWEPNLDLNLHTAANKLDEENQEVILTVTVTVKIKEKVVFLIEIKQAGIFSLVGFPEDQMKHMLASYCPNILYPYAREVVTDIVVKAGFPNLYLAPVNFDALFQQQLQQETNQPTNGDTEQ